MAITSLLAGRNVAPLTEAEQRRAFNTFRGLEPEANVRYEAGTSTRFRVAHDEEGGVDYGEIVFGEDIYPGRGVADPNSSLSLRAAVAHELTHLKRWENKTELPHGHLTDIDEALTSLEAILRYRDLDETEVQQLARDAVIRLQVFAQANEPK